MPKREYPAGVDDHPGILAYAEVVEDEAQSYRAELEYNGVGNILYYLGYQWQTFEPSFGRWRPLAYNYKPVVNRFAPLVNTIASMLVRFNVPITYSPSTDEPADVAAARVADSAHKVIEKETKVRQWTPEAARWAVKTGNVFLISGFDISTKYGMRPIQQLQCVGSGFGAGCGAIVSPLEAQTTQGVCPRCGGQGGLVPAMQNGQPVMGQAPRGRHTTEVKSPLHCYFDNQATYFEDSPYYMVEDRVPPEWIENAYGMDAVDRIANAESKGSRTLVDSLTYATGTAGLGSTGEDDGSYRMRRLWIEPNEARAPQGIYAVIVGDTVMEAIPYPFRNEYKMPMRPVVHIPFDQVPGRLLAKSRCDDLRGLQDTLNKIEAYLDLHTKRMAGGKLLLPRGVGIGRVVGETGQTLTYDAMPGVPPPQFIPGMSVPQYFFQWQQLTVAAMDAVMGTYEVSRGEAPKGVSAYAAIQFLDEQGQQAQSNLQDNWALGKMMWARQQLNIFREFADEPRILSLGVGRWSAKKFSKADLAGGVDLDVDIGYSRPRTQVARRAVVDQFVRLGGVNMMDPYEKYPVAVALGATDLMPDVAVDKERAARENDAFINPPDPALPPPPPDMPALAGFPMPFPWDRHIVHLAEHRNLLFGDRGDTLPPPNRQALISHMMIHQREVAMQMQQGSLGPGQVAPAGPGNTDGKNDGTAKEGSRGDEQREMDTESQMASPDTFTGAAQ